MTLIRFDSINCFSFVTPVSFVWSICKSTFLSKPDWHWYQTNRSQTGYE